MKSEIKQAGIGGHTIETQMELQEEGLNACPQEGKK